MKLWLASTLEWIQSTVWAGFTQKFSVTSMPWFGGFWLVFFVVGFVVCCWFFFLIHVMNQKMAEGFENTHTIPSLWLYYKAHSTDILLSLYHHLGLMKRLWGCNSSHIMLSYWYCIWSIHFCCLQCVDKVYILINAHCN